MDTTSQGWTDRSIWPWSLLPMTAKCSRRCEKPLAEHYECSSPGKIPYGILLAAVSLPWSRVAYNEFRIFIQFCIVRYGPVFLLCNVCWKLLTVPKLWLVYLTEVVGWESDCSKEILCTPGHYSHPDCTFQKLLRELHRQTQKYALKPKPLACKRYLQNSPAPCCLWKSCICRGQEIASLWAQLSTVGKAFEVTTPAPLFLPARQRDSVGFK